MTKKGNSNPTFDTYDTLDAAYDHFNKTLFGGELPRCLVVLQRHSKVYGYFCGSRFKGRDDAEGNVDEIALNPTHFRERPDRQTFSTLVHEMVHLWQHHFGDAPNRAYHNKEWADKMEEVGLMPSDTGAPGGKRTGQKCSHYIVDGGVYDDAWQAFQSDSDVYRPLLIDIWGEEGAAAKTAAKKRASKTKYTCPDCEANAWAKPGSKLICGECNVEMEGEEQ